MTIKSKEILEQIRPEDKSLLQEKELTRRFGRPEDCVELHVYDLNGNLLNTVYNFEEYEIPDINDTEGLFNEIIFNPDKVLRDLGYTSGDYDLRVNFHRKKIANTLENQFYISTISPSRTELRVKIINDENLSPLINATNQFIAELGDNVEGVAYFKDFALNLGNDVVLTGVNFIAEQGKNNSFLIKLYEPLPNSFNEKAQFRIIEEITNPINYRVSLENIETLDTNSTELRGPNLRIDTRLNSSIPTAYKTYNDILSYSGTSLNSVINALSASIPLSIEYDNPNTDTGYIYDKFIHFGSAEERLRNFKYKLELIELYDSKNALMDSLSNPLYSPSIKKQNEDLKNKIIQQFDGYENHLYFNSGAYSWPKRNNLKPFINYSVTSSEAEIWFNTHIENSENFDDQNPYILRNTLPQYIIDNEQNEQFILFTDMIGQHFDNIWIYIENITDKNIAHNSLNEGISKDLVFNALKEKGIPAFDQFENKDLFSYFIYDTFENYDDSANKILTDESGNPLTTEDKKQILVNVSTTPTIVSGSNSRVPLQDVTKEIWKRLYHNAPYLLKTKGTERGIKALLACYGIPESILHVKEYGGPNSNPKSDFRVFKYPKMQKAIEIKGTNLGTQLLMNFPLGWMKTNATIEFTILPQGDHQENLILADFYSANGYLALDRHPVHTESARLKHVDQNGNIVYSNYFPAYCGRPVTIFLDTAEASALRAGTRTIGNATIRAGMFVDNEYFEVVLSNPATFKTINNTTLPIAIGQTIFHEDKTSNFLVHNYKIYGSPLSSNIRKIHSKDSNILASTSTSSFFEDDELFFYSPLGANLIEDRPAENFGFTDYSYLDNTAVAPLVSAGPPEALIYKEIEYDHYLVTPDTVGATMASEKIRYDQGEIEDNILSPIVRGEESTLDRQPQDFSNLGVFFSPTFEINEDIVHTLGGFRLDEYIGDPRHLDNSEYPDLKSLRDEYSKKIINRYNFWDYLRTIQFFDHTIFKIIEEFVPVKANLKTGFVIEPHYLERNKINYANTDFSQISFPDFDIPDVNPSIDSEYILYETTIDVEEVLDGSGGEFRNNFTHSRISNKRFRVAENRQ